MKHIFSFAEQDIIAFYDADIKKSETDDYMVIPGKVVSVRMGNKEMQAVKLGFTLYRLPQTDEDESIALEIALLPDGTAWACYPGGIAFKQCVHKYHKKCFQKYNGQEFLTHIDLPVMARTPYHNPQPTGQIAALLEMGIDPLSIGAKKLDGALYKPDADPDAPGPCSICGTLGYWISGAGRYLCAEHQDDY